MINEQNTKLVAVTVPDAIVDNASFTTTEVDTKGWDYATYYVMLGATDIAMAALAVTESDTAGSGHTNVSGLVFGTSNNTSGTASTLPSATDDGLIFAMEIDLRNRKRYLDLTSTAGNGTLGTYAAAWCVLSRCGTTPDTAAERGCSQVLRA